MIINMQGMGSGGSSIPSYSGSYTVNSKLSNTQILSTSGKLMVSDLTINPISVTRTNNQYGGITVEITEVS